MEFQCKHGLNDLCFFGGRCNNRTSTTDRQVCICPSGFAPDLTLFHDPNCTLPKNALLIFFIENAIVVFFLCLVLFREHQKSRGKIKRLVNFVALTLICSATYSMTLYLENGMFEASLVAVMLFLWAFLRTIVEVANMFFKSASSIVEARASTNKARTVMTRTAALLEVALIVMLIALIVLCRTDRYNTVYASCMLVLAGFNILLIGFILREINQLRAYAIKELARMPSGNEILSAKWTDFRKRLLILKCAIYIYTAIFVVGLVSLPIIHFVLGSSPFSWVFLFAASHIASLACMCIFCFLRQPMSATHSFFAVGDNLESEEVTAYRSMFGVRTPIITGRLHISIGNLMSSRPATNYNTNVETYESSIANAASSHHPDF